MKKWLLYALLMNLKDKDIAFFRPLYKFEENPTSFMGGVVTLAYRYSKLACKEHTYHISF